MDKPVLLFKISETFHPSEDQMANARKQIKDKTGCEVVFMQGFDLVGMISSKEEAIKYFKITEQDFKEFINAY